MILFVDDEEEMDSYRMGLELSGFEVTFMTRVDDAWDYFNRNRSRISLVILDISMPAGEILKDYDTQAGMRTGVVFFDKLREQAPDLPIVIFTNVSDEKVKSSFSKESNYLFIQKPEELPSTLAQQVKKLLSNRPA